LKKNTIGNRIKDNYENRYRIKLTRRTPVIIRLDGKAFHTLTRDCQKPFDKILQTIMENTASKLCSEIQGVKCAYVQSDEISLLLTDFSRLTTDAWFDYNLQKIVSVSAGIASAYFTTHYMNDDNIAVFDSRAFNIPKEEVCNYFIWRQQDWLKNSIQMLSQTYYSAKQLHNKNTLDMHELLYKKNINWANLELIWKNGSFIYKSGRKFKIDHSIIFTKNREIIEQFNTPIKD